MNALKIKIIYISGTNGILDVIVGGLKCESGDDQMLCFSGEGVNVFDLANAKHELPKLSFQDESGYLLWKTHRQNSRSAIIVVCIVAQTILYFTLAWLGLYYVCELVVECYAYVFPVIFVSTTLIASISMLEWIKNRWVSGFVYDVENKSAFCIVNREKDDHQPFFALMDSKTKTYGGGQTYPISLLHCKYPDSSATLSVALFHLPNEMDLHQAVGCDVIDSLKGHKKKAQPSHFLPRYHHGENAAEIIVVLYYTLRCANRARVVDEFIAFLNKSGFCIIAHKLDFVVVAARHSTQSSYQNIAEDAGGIAFEIHLPQG
jgi:hypothetical protein